MKILISVDIEGVAGVYHSEQVQAIPSLSGRGGS